MVIVIYRCFILKLYLILDEVLKIFDFFFLFVDSYCCEEFDFDIEIQNFDCVKDVVDILCDCSEIELEILELIIDIKEY